MSRISAKELGLRGKIRNCQVRFEINGPGLSTVVEIPAEAPMEDVAGWPVLFAGALSVKLLKVFT